MVDLQLAFQRRPCAGPSVSGRQPDLLFGSISTGLLVTSPLSKHWPAAVRR